MFLILKCCVGIKLRSHQGKSSRIKDGLRRDDQARTGATSFNPTFQGEVHRHPTHQGHMELGQGLVEEANNFRRVNQR